MLHKKLEVSRRSFIVSSTSTALIFALNLSSPIALAAASSQKAPIQPDAFVKIDQDDTVTITIKHIEFGQGVFTGLATIVAEEMDASWNQIKCKHAAADVSKYANPAFGVQGTGGSTAIATAYMQMREVGAAARAMLVSAASQKWGVPSSEIKVEGGRISHSKTGKSSGFGAFAKQAAQQPVPQSPKLKSPEDFKLIGSGLPRKDDGKTDGTAIYTQDIQLPGMHTAVVLHPPRFGAKLKSFDSKKAMKMEGVHAVVEVPSGVAIIADTFWQAKSARDQVKASWDETSALSESDDDLLNAYKALAEKNGATATNTGDVKAAFEKADKIVEASYSFPYLAHAAMEPMNCVVQIDWDKKGQKAQAAEFWFGCQLPTGDQGAASQVLGIEPSRVKINTVFAGGSFGRRGSGTSDYVVEATHIAKAYGKPNPVKLVWTREDDTRAGAYRPLNFHKLKAGLDKKGRIIAWQHRIVGQSILTGTPMEVIIQNGVDITSVEGAIHSPYDIPNHNVELHSPKNAVPVLWWRSVASTHTAYSTEAFIDEIARDQGEDPLQYRLKMMGKDLRHLGVLKLVSEKSGYGKRKLPENHFIGLALHKSFNTYVAQVAELSKSKAGYKLEKVWCAVDCGVAINPDVVKAQMEGGIAFGLSAAIMSKITIKDGKVEQSNFHDYQVVRMKDMPDVEVYVVPSAEPPTGVGEPGTPVIAPAIASALRAAGERELYQLPVGVKFV